MSGDLPDLGSWNSLNYKLEWHQDDIWTSTEPVFVPIEKNYFEYKYCVVREAADGSGLFEYWGPGVNRISDLRLREVVEEVNGNKVIHIKDYWNTSNQQGV